MLGNSPNAFGAAIIGGQENTTQAYVALVSSSGETTALSGPALPVGLGQILSVSINASGAAIIGGDDNGFSTNYAALVSSSGVTTALTGPALPSGGGSIFSVSINDSGSAIIGGNDNFGFDPYVALVSSSGVTAALSGGALPVGSGSINNVAINASGAAIIGGADNGPLDPYAALVSPSGVTTALSGGALPTGFGNIDTVAINASGAAIIGGDDNGFTSAYAALVSSSGVTTALSGAALPPANGSINSVAINSSGSAIVGGRDSSTSAAYVALVSPSGVTTALTGAALPVGDSTITSVAINTSGAAIIGGRDNTNSGYAALVSPSGVTTALSGAALPVGNALIVDVGIGDSGAAIIGGRDNTNSPYVALVSPSGVTTALTGAALPTGNGQISSVSINEASSGGGGSVDTLVVPSSFGPGSSFANSLFALTSQILPNHCMFYHKPSRIQNDQLDREIGLLVDATDKVRWKTPCAEKTNYSFWAAGFGDYAHQDKEQSFPALTNWIAGAMIGFDYRGIQNTIIGGGVAYAFNYVDFSEDQGDARIHQEFVTVYGSWDRKNFYINAALWGGPYQMHNKRRTLGIITSKSDSNGWLLSPHLEISTPFYAKEDWFLIDPFAMFDWANNWQGSVREKGSSGFNINLDEEYTSVLRSELGIRFFESIRYEWGSLILQEKGSWVNKAPFDTSTAAAFFVGSASSFSVEVFSNKMQNLGVAQLSAHFIPCNYRYPYGSLNYQGEFGSSFQSHLVSFEIGRSF